MDEICHAREVGFAVSEEAYLAGVSGVAVPVMFAAARGDRCGRPVVQINSQLQQIGRLVVKLTAMLRPTGPRVSAPTGRQAAA
jgi:hypothetical protein